MHKGIFFIIDDEGVVEMAEEIEIMDAQTMKRALTRITHEILEKNDGTEN